MHIMLLPVVNVVAVEVHQAGSGDVETTTCEHVVLYCNVVEVLFFVVKGGLHLDESPAVPWATLQDVHPYKYARMAKSCLKDGRNGRVSYQGRRPG